MTTYVEARDTLVSYIHTTLQTVAPTLPVFWENTDKVDVNTVGDSFVQVAIDFDNTLLATVSNDLTENVLGYIGFRVFAKEGQGTRTTLALFDALASALRQRDIGGIRTGTPTQRNKVSQNGWMSLELGVPFTYYT